MAILVAQSRIEGKIHTFWETVAGALLGILVAMLVFQIKIFNFYYTIKVYVEQAFSNILKSE